MTISASSGPSATLPAVAVRAANATRVEIAVPIFSGPGVTPNNTATASLAVEP